MRINHVNLHAHILRVGGQVKQRETQRVGAVAVNHVARVKSIAQTFAHALAKAILNNRMDIDMLERNFSTQKISVEHGHAAHPQSDDVARRAQHAAWVVTLKHALHVGKLFWMRPAQGAQRPKRGAEPCVKNILILLETRRDQLRRHMLKLKRQAHRFLNAAIVALAHAMRRAQHGPFGIH